LILLQLLHIIESQTHLKQKHKEHHQHDKDGYSAYVTHLFHTPVGRSAPEEANKQIVGQVWDMNSLLQLDVNEVHFHKLMVTNQTENLAKEDEEVQHESVVARGDLWYIFLRVSRYWVHSFVPLVKDVIDYFSVG
jgi:hypothetical protein